MSFVSKEKTASATFQVSAAIGAEDFCKQLDITFEKELKNITMPGFRKGKAPRSMVEKRYGDEIFFEQALDALLPAAVAKAIEEAELEPQFRPENLEVQEINKENGAQFTFTVIVKPEMTIEGYEGIEAEVPGTEVEDVDIDARIEELQKRNARQVEVASRPAKDGDIAVIDFKGMLDGVAFAGGTAENHELLLGSGQFIPGFEEQIVGRTPGEESFDVNVTFPEEYHAEELAGKAVMFECMLHELKAEELPPVDDDFAQEVGEDYNTVADLRAGLAKELAETKQKEADDAFEKAIQNALIEKLEGEIPEAMFERRTQQNIEMFLERFQIPLEQYLQIFGETEEQFTARIGEQSIAQVKLELALEAIAAAQNFEPTAEEIEAEQQKLAEQYDVTIERVKFAVPEDDIKKEINRGKAMEFVKKSAVKTVV